MSALAALGAVAAFQGPPPLPPPAPTSPAPAPRAPTPPARAVVVAPTAELLTAPDAGAPSAGRVFRNQVVAVDLWAEPRALIVRADGVTGWLDVTATAPAP